MPCSTLSLKFIALLNLYNLWGNFSHFTVEKNEIQKGKINFSSSKVVKHQIDIAGGSVVNLQYGFFIEKFCGCLGTGIPPRLTDFLVSYCLKYKIQEMIPFPGENIESLGRG